VLSGSTVASPAIGTPVPGTASTVPAPSAAVASAIAGPQTINSSAPTNTATSAAATSGAPTPSNRIGTIPISAVVQPAARPAAQRINAPISLNEWKPTRVFWEGPQQVRVGRDFSVVLRMVSDRPVLGAPMQVRFDPSVLESVGVRPGKHYDLEEGRTFSYRMSQDGTIFVGASNSSPTTSSNMELLILTFKPIKPASAVELSVASLTAEGSAGSNIPLQHPVAFKTAVTQ
jgi:hypothetical protein